MITPQLVDYIRSELSKGISREEIQRKLFDVGWKDVDVNEIFDSLKDGDLAQYSSPSRKIPTILVLTLILIALITIAGIFGYLNLRKVAKEKELKTVTEEKVETETGFQSNNQTSLPALVPSFDLWEEFKFENSNFSARFPAEPVVESNKYNNTDHSLYESSVGIQGDNIKYGVDHFRFSDTKADLSEKEKASLSMFTVKLTFKSIYGKNVSFSPSEPIFGYTTENYLVTSPKRYEGKIVVVGTTAFVINGECLYCQNIPYLSEFINSFKFIDKSANLSASVGEATIQSEFVVDTIKVKVPNTTNYTYSTFIPAELGQYVSRSMTISYDPKGSDSSNSSPRTVMLITKSPNQDAFNKAYNSFDLKNYSPSNDFYAISGTSGALFNGKTSTVNEGEKLLIIPTKAVIIYIKSQKSIGISETTLNAIIKSIQL